MTDFDEPPFCRACKWAEPVVLVDGDDSHLTLECHRFPPQITMTDDGTAHQVWPQMQSNDWCGEFAMDLEDG